MTRALVDSYLFVSALISPAGSASALLAHWQHRLVTIVMSDWQRDELADVLSRPKFAVGYDISLEQTTSLFEDIDELCEMTTAPTASPIGVRDPKDEAILACAIHSQVDYLLIGDRDLLELRSDRRLGRLKIATSSEFLQTLGP